MLGEIDFSKKLYKTSYFLAKPNKEIISKLSEAYKDNLKTPVNQTYELSLSIPYFIDLNHVLTKNKNIDLVNEDYLILMKYGNIHEWFTIHTIDEVMEEGSDYKQISAYSLNYELAQRSLIGYTAESKGAKTVLIEILDGTTWTVGDIDVDFELSKRSFEFLDNKILGSIYEIADKYNAVVQFDTDAQTVNFRKRELFGQNKGLTFSYESLLKGFDKKSDSNEIVTRLRLEGKDGLTINSISPTGKSHLEDYSYYMYPFSRDINKNVIEHSTYMSDSLCHAILDYQELVKNNKDQFGLLKTSRDNYVSVISNKQSELIDLQNQLKDIYIIVDNYQLDTTNTPTMFFENIDYSGTAQVIDFNSLQTMYSYAVMAKVSNATNIQVSLNGSLKTITSNTWIILGKINNLITSSVLLTGSGNATVNIQVTAINDSEYTSVDNDQAIIERYNPNHKQMQIDIKTAEIVEQTGYLNTIISQITSLQNLFLTTNNFTPEQLIELQRFIKENAYKDDTIIDAQDLLDEGEKKFKEIRVPLLSMDIDIVNFLSILEEQSKWDKLVLGDEVTVRYERMEIKIKAKIIEINYDFEADSISLTIANVKNENDAEKMSNYFDKYDKFSTTIDTNKADWLKSVTDVSDMSRLFDEFYDKVTNQINMSVNNTVSIDNRGITIIDPTDVERFLRATAGAIGLTKSGGLRYELALTPDGLVAETIYGKIVLSQRVIVGDAAGIWLMEGPRTTIKDRYGRIAMLLGLYEENPDKFGMIINRYNGNDVNSTLINKVIANSEDGFKIQRFNGHSYDDKMSIDMDGNLLAQDMTAKRLKIVSNQNELLLDSYTKEMNIGKFTDIITDGKLTGIEKLQVLGERTRIMSEYVKLLDQANAYKLTSRDDTVRINIPPFTAAYNALIAYLEPLLSNMTITSDINRDEFILKFKVYYDAVVAIVNGINDSIKYSSVQFGSYFNNVLIDYINGVTATRSDNMYRSRQSGTDGFIIERNVGTSENPVWVKVFWADLGGIVHAEGLKINNSFITDGGIEGSYIILRDGMGGVMKLYPSEGFWAGAENAGDAPTWIKPNGEAIFKKLIVKNGVDGGLMIDSENKFIDFNSWDLKGAGAVDAKLISANMVSAELGYISDIVAKSVSTMTRAAITGWSNFIEIKDKTIQWITGKVTQGEHISVNGKPMYWVDSSQTGIMTTEVTPWPVYKYISNDADKKVKMEAGFDGTGDDANPYISMGIGDGTPNGAKARIAKYNGGLKTSYGQSNYGKERSIDIKDDGVFILSEGSDFNVKSKDFNFIVDGGKYKLSLSDGSQFELAPGSLNANIIGDINFKATGKINFEASEYNFK